MFKFVFAFRFGYRSFCVLCDRRKLVRACCTVHPSEVPERLSLRVLRARGCIGKEKQKVGWSKTMVWPPSAPSQMCMGWGARDQETRVCCEHVRNAGVWPLSDSELGVTGSGHWLSALCYGEKKSTGVRPPSAPSQKWVGRGTGLSRWCSYGKSTVAVLCSRS